ncbi:MAG: hypothetical protein VXY93_22795, partial [Pseudomonadota bacterium]|nr:hypothetical protein [Pseudomonadota bacterium]
DQVTSDRVVLEALEHLAAEQLEVQGAGVTRSIVLTLTCEVSSQSRTLMCHFLAKIKRGYVQRVDRSNKFVVFSHRHDGKGYPPQRANANN